MAAARCEIARLLDVVLSATLAWRAPLDAYRVAAISPAFRAADDANADAVWSRLLPRDLLPLADRELPPIRCPRSSSSCEGVFTSFKIPKNFTKFLSHRIFGRIHESLNISKK
jgi:hypothetical protein